MKIINPQRMREGYSNQSCLWVCVCVTTIPGLAWIAVLQFQSQQNDCIYRELNPVLGKWSCVNKALD